MAMLGHPAGFRLFSHDQHGECKKVCSCRVANQLLQEQDSVDFVISMATSQEQPALKLDSVEGSCHCKAVQFTVKDVDLSKVTKCNCSVCDEALPP